LSERFCLCARLWSDSSQLCLARTSHFIGGSGTSLESVTDSCSRSSARLTPTAQSPPHLPSSHGPISTPGSRLPFSLHITSPLVGCIGRWFVGRAWWVPARICPKTSGNLRCAIMPMPMPMLHALPCACTSASKGQGMVTVGRAWVFTRGSRSEDSESLRFRALEMVDHPRSTGCLFPATAQPSPILTFLDRGDRKRRAASLAPVEPFCYRKLGAHSSEIGSCFLT
jgi:hypothetical protein